MLIIGPVTTFLIALEALQVPTLVTLPHSPVAGLRSAVAACSLDVRKVVTIGDNSGIEFGRIASGVFVHDTIIAVGDGIALNIRFFSTAGRLLATHGRKGEGPGEFNDIRSLSTLADTLVVYDTSLRRLSVLSMGDGYLRSQPAAVGLIKVLKSGEKLFARNPAGVSYGRSGPELWPDTLHIILERANGASRLISKVADGTRIVDVSKSFNRSRVRRSG